MTRSQVDQDTLQGRLMPERCTVCGARKWSAYWVGAETEIAVCRSCAVETLPALIADALADERPTIHVLLQHVERIRLRFWRALALALTNGSIRR
jgi:hypothetical protein